MGMTLCMNRSHVTSGPSLDVLPAQLTDSQLAQYSHTHLHSSGGKKFPFLPAVHNLLHLQNYPDTGNGAVLLVPLNEMFQEILNNHPLLIFSWPFPICLV